MRPFDQMMIMRRALLDLCIGADTMLSCFNEQEDLALCRFAQLVRQKARDALHEASANPPPVAKSVTNKVGDL